MRMFTSFFKIIIGSGMIGIWAFLFITKQIPEVQTEPIRIMMHIAAELATGIMLLISGLYYLLKSKKHKILFNLSFGALIYTLIVSPGYYAQQGSLPVFVSFMVLLVISIVLIIVNARAD